MNTCLEKIQNSLLKNKYKNRLDRIEGPLLWEKYLGNSKKKISEKRKSNKKSLNHHNIEDLVSRIFSDRHLGNINILAKTKQESSVSITAIGVK